MAKTNSWRRNSFRRRDKGGAMRLMLGSSSSLIGIGAIHALLVLAGAGVGLAQGSTGGKIGKTDQERSGDLSKGTPDKQGQRKQDQRASKVEPSATPTALTAASLRGRWNGSLNCPDGSWSLHLDIRENSSSSFGGEYGGEGGKIVNGTLSGTRVSFVTQATISRSWSGSVLRTGRTLRMQGTHKSEWGTTSTGAGNCKVSFSKA